MGRNTDIREAVEAELGEDRIAIAAPTPQIAAYLFLSAHPTRGPRVWQRDDPLTETASRRVEPWTRRSAGAMLTVTACGKARNLEGHAVVEMVGRRHECAALDRLVADVLAGASRVLVLRGEAGVGKSALMGYISDR